MTLCEKDSDGGAAYLRFYLCQSTSTTEVHRQEGATYKGKNPRFGEPMDIIIFKDPRIRSPMRKQMQVFWGNQTEYVA